MDSLEVGAEMDHKLLDRIKIEIQHICEKKQPQNNKMMPKVSC